MTLSLSIILIWANELWAVSFSMVPNSMSRGVSGCVCVLETVPWSLTILHGGHIWKVSATQRKDTFYITFPLNLEFNLKFKFIQISKEQSYDFAACSLPKSTLNIVYFSVENQKHIFFVCFQNLETFTVNLIHLNLSYTKKWPYLQYLSCHTVAGSD